MTTKQTSQLTGFFFILGALLVNIPYTLLIINFDYPDILRAPADLILIEFEKGGTALIWTWLAFAWVGLPMLLGTIMLKSVLKHEGNILLNLATTFGILGFVVQVVGLLRWVFVVPMLAHLYNNPLTPAGTKEAVVVLFLAQHQYGGVLLGEHIGQLFVIMWMSLMSFIIYRSPLFASWVAWLGWVASAVYLLAQTELLGTVMVGFPVVEWAGLVGSLLWLLWMIVLGGYLLKFQPLPEPEKQWVTG